MNQYGFIAGPTSNLPTASSGLVIMDNNGLSMMHDASGGTVYDEKRALKFKTTTGKKYRSDIYNSGIK